jgi:hypothetical protein
LLLRSFARDGNDESEPNTRSGNDPFVTRIEVERLLVKALRPALGPVVTLGKPDDFMPASGAPRRYVKDSDWQAVVDAYVRKAAAVVFIVSHWTDAIRWELTLVRAHHEPHQIVLILIPPESRAPHDRSACALFAELGLVRERRERWGAVIRFSSDWSPIVDEQGVVEPDAYAGAAARILLTSRATESGRAISND